jgi:hypothetical protein
MSNEKHKDTSHPKTEPAAAAPHNPFAAFDPTGVWTQAQANFQKMMGDAYGRAQGWADEYAAMEAQMFARANSAIDTWAQLARDTLAYGAQLSAQARKLGFEAARKAGVGA